jgi:hypothetical protein
MLGFAACVLGTSIAIGQAPSDGVARDQRAVVGSSSESGGGRGQTSTGLAFERALRIAKESGRQSPTVEQLLVALLDDADVRDALVTRYVDVNSLRASLTEYVERQPPIEPTAADPFGRDPKLTPVLRRSTFKGVAENRDPLATDLLTAILVEGDSFAAKTLADHGLTVQEAENAAVEHYLAAQKENDVRMAETQRRIAAEAERSKSAPSAQPQFSIAESQSSSASPVEARSYTLRIDSGGSTEMRFKAAVSHDGVLDLYVESTPFETTFTAHQVVALYEAVDRGSLRAQLFANADGVRQSVAASAGGEAGAIFEDVYQRGARSSGRLR